MRIVAMLQVYNERRFVAACIEHLWTHGVEVYVIDNESTDDTVAIAERYLGRGVIGIETLPRGGCYSQRLQCARQDELSAELDADWLIHHDADEIRTTRRPRQRLADALRELDEAGYNAVNVHEFVFVPTREAPDHDHPRFQETMRHYYPFEPRTPHRLNAWKRQDGPVELAWSAGHTVRFNGLRMAPVALNLRHYLFLSVPHAVEKFVHRRFDPDEVANGWFGWRATLGVDEIHLPSASDLRPFVADHLLDHSQPLQRHLLDPAADMTRDLASETG
jgi:glycosyltransferase involved in cell wall biosynthesis